MSAAPPNTPDSHVWNLPARGSDSDPDALVVGLVNSASETARRSTERQFRTLLAAASRGRRVELRVSSLPCAAGMGCDEDFLDGIDGLIVTGMEPQAATLPEEPCWPALQRLADWAESSGVPTIWSCLAAHAVVLHQSGVHRQPRAAKLSGLYECHTAAEHPLLAGLPLRWRVPHSRCNELDEQALIAGGYQVISRSTAAGADMFIRQANSLSLCIQGHPEYEAQTLLLEYRRDVGRFLAGERDGYPAMPENYFDPGATAALFAFRARALRAPHPDRMAEFPMAEAAKALTHEWRGVGIGLCANWLSLLDRRTSGSVGLRSPFSAGARAAPNMKAAP